MDVALVPFREGPLAAFRAGLEGRYARIECFSDGWTFLKAARKRLT